MSSAKQIAAVTHNTFARSQPSSPTDAREGKPLCMYVHLDVGEKGSRKAINFAGAAPRTPLEFYQSTMLMMFKSPPIQRKKRIFLGFSDFKNFCRRRLSTGALAASPSKSTDTATVSPQSQLLNPPLPPSALAIGSRLRFPPPYGRPKISKTWEFDARNITTVRRLSDPPPECRSPRCKPTGARTLPPRSQTELTSLPG